MQEQEPGFVVELHPAGGGPIVRRAYQGLRSPLRSRIAIASSTGAADAAARALFEGIHAALLASARPARVAPVLDAHRDKDAPFLVIVADRGVPQTCASALPDDPCSALVAMLPEDASPEHVLPPELRRARCWTWSSSPLERCSDLLDAAGLDLRGGAVRIAHDPLDTAGLAVQVYDALRDEGFAVSLVDASDADGADPAAEAAQSLRDPAALVIVATERVRDSRWTGHAVTYARELDRTCLTVQPPAGAPAIWLGPEQHVSLADLAARLRSEQQQARAQRQASVLEGLRIAFARRGLIDQQIDPCGYLRVRVGSESHALWALDRYPRDEQPAHRCRCRGSDDIVSTFIAPEDGTGPGATGSARSAPLVVPESRIDALADAILTGVPLSPRHEAADERGAALAGRSIALCASVPDAAPFAPVRETAHARTQLERSIVALARAVFAQGGRFILTGCTAVAALLAHAAAGQHRPSDSPPVTLHLPRAGRARMAPALADLAEHGLVSLCWHDSGAGSKRADLDAARAAMIEDPSLAALVCLGGGPHTEREAELFTTRAPHLPIYGVAATGGATRHLCDTRLSSRGVPIPIRAADREILEGVRLRLRAADGELVDAPLRTPPYPLILRAIVRELASPSR